MDIFCRMIFQYDKNSNTLLFTDENITKEKIRAQRNHTIILTNQDIFRLKNKLIIPEKTMSVEEITNKTIYFDLFKTLEFLPEKFVDLLFIDPPYNLTKQFNFSRFKEMPSDKYEEWIDSWLGPLCKILKTTASVYICCDWKSSSAIFRVMSRYFKVRNRITWEREKGRGQEPTGRIAQKIYGLALFQIGLYLILMQ